MFFHTMSVVYVWFTDVWDNGIKTWHLRHYEEANVPDRCAPLRKAEPSEDQQQDSELCCSALRTFCEWQQLGLGLRAHTFRDPHADQTRSSRPKLTSVVYYHYLSSSARTATLLPFVVVRKSLDRSASSSPRFIHEKNGTFSPLSLLRRSNNMAGPVLQRLIRNTLNSEICWDYFKVSFICVM